MLVGGGAGAAAAAAAAVAAAAAAGGCCLLVVLWVFGVFIACFSFLSCLSLLLLTEAVGVAPQLPLRKV